MKTRLFAWLVFLLFCFGVYRFAHAWHSPWSRPTAGARGIAGASAPLVSGVLSHDPLWIPNCHDTGGCSK